MSFYLNLKRNVIFFAVGDVGTQSPQHSHYSNQVG